MRPAFFRMQGGAGMRVAKLLILFLSIGPLARARAETLVFQESALLPSGGAYAGTQDTEIDGSLPTQSFGEVASVRSDLAFLGGEAQGLLRFDGIVGPLPDRIPPGSTITSALLTVEVFNSSNAPAGIISLHRMTAPWNEASSWDSLGSGVQVGSETATSPDDAHTAEQIAAASFDVQASLQAWAAGQDNFGWLISNDSSDGVEFHSSESETAELRPRLTVTFTPPEAPIAVPALSRAGIGLLLAVLTMTAVAATGGGGGRRWRARRGRARRLPPS